MFIRQVWETVLKYLESHVPSSTATCQPWVKILLQSGLQRPIFKTLQVKK